MHSTLAIVDRPFVFATDSAPAHVGVWVVEGVERILRRYLDLAPPAGCPVLKDELHRVDVGVPEEDDFDAPGQPLGQLSRRLARDGSAVVLHCFWAAGAASHRTRPSSLTARSGPSRRRNPATPRRSSDRAECR